LALEGSQTTPLVFCFVFCFFYGLALRGGISLGHGGGVTPLKSASTNLVKSLVIYPFKPTCD
jgi:hypothetical protein